MLKKIIIIFLIPLGLMAQSKFQLSCNKHLISESLKIGLQQVGTVDRTTQNDGAVEKYLQSVGLAKGNPYCAAGQYYCFNEAVKCLHLPQKSIPIPRTGLANAIFNYAKVNGEKVRYKASINDLIIWRRGDTPFGHVERIIDVMDKGFVRTLAFNVPNEQNQEGVFIKKRNIYHPIRRLKIRGLIGFRSL